MATVSTPGAPEPPINRLPIEVLQDVFHKVAQRSETIRHIRLTCRYWRDLVTSDLTLPRRIVIHHMIGEMDTRSHHSAMGDYCTHTLGGLAKALGYIQDAMFHLDLRLDKVLSSKDEEYDKVPWSRFQTQCTSLAVYSTDKTVGYFVNFLGYLPTLENLSSLSDMEYSEATSLILQRIPPNRPRLQSLVAASDWDLGRIHDANAYQHFQQVLRRLKTFQANQLRSLSSLILLLVSFEDLEDLTLKANMFEFNWTEQDLDFIRQSVDWNFQPKVLDINIRMLSVFPPSLLRGLTRLSLCRLDEQDDVSLEEPKLDLPRLTFLSLNSSRSSLFRFEAPNLKDLSLINTRWHERFNRAQSLRPTLVEINDGPDSTTAFLSDPPFPDINELHIHTTVFDDYGLPQMLSSSISGQSPLLPNLQHLLVIMHLFRRVRPERQEVFRRTILGALSSCDRLISVRCSLT